MTKSQAVKEVGERILTQNKRHYVPGVGIITPKDVEKSKKREVKKNGK